MPKNDIERLPDPDENADVAQEDPPAEKTGWESYQHGVGSMRGMMMSELGGAPVSAQAKEIMIRTMQGSFVAPLNNFAGKPGMLAQAEAIWSAVRSSTDTDPRAIAEPAAAAFHRLLSTNYTFEEFSRALYNDPASTERFHAFHAPEKARHERATAALRIIDWNENPARSNVHKTTRHLGATREALVQEMNDLRYTHEIFERLLRMSSHETTGWRILRSRREAADRPLRDASRQLLAEGLPAMERSVRYRPYQLADYKHGLEELYERGTDEQRQAALESRERMRDIMPEISPVEDATNLLRGTPAEREATLHMTRTGIWGSEAETSRSLGCIEELMKSKDPVRRQQGEEILRQALTDRGLDAAALFQAWEHGTPSDFQDARDYMLRGTFSINTSVIAKLERAHRGSAALLQKRYGICMFMRYPLELLIKQYETRDEKDKPQAVVVFPHGDWNNAFTSHAPTNQFDTLQQQLGDKYTLRFSETGGRYGFMRSLARMHRDHGKISFAVIGGHGTADGIHFGDNNSHQNRLLLRRRDLRTSGMARMGREFFEPGATVLLESCSTGQKGGIAQRMAEAWGVTVIGPNKPSSVMHYTLDTSGKTPAIADIEYMMGAQAGRFTGKR